MTDADKWRLAHGEPEHINWSIGASGGQREQWVYPGGEYIYFVNGKFSAAQIPTK